MIWKLVDLILFLCTYSDFFISVLIMQDLLKDIRQCEICSKHLLLGPRPIVTAHPDSKIIIIGQAPGTKVHKTGIPWDDLSGKQLRKWLNVSEEEFYNTKNFAIIPMGFCYPGKGKTGDLPPRPECAPQWHEQLLDKMPNVELVILIGMYAQKYYLQKTAKKTLTIKPICQSILYCHILRQEIVFG